MDKLLAFMEGWGREGRLAVEREIRPLLRDYVEILLYTGMRHGTEAMGLCWNHVNWQMHEARSALERHQQRQSKLKALTFDELLGSQVKDPVFVTSGGYQPHRIDGTFKRLLRDSGLEIVETGQRRTLYGLRHTYATRELLAGRASIHDLENLVGTSISMIRKHYSKASESLGAGRLAGSWT